MKSETSRPDIVQSPIRKTASIVKKMEDKRQILEKLMQEKTGSTTLKIQTGVDRQDSFLQSPYKRDSVLISPLKSVFTPHEVRLSKLKLNLEKATIQDKNPDKKDELASKVDQPKLTLIERVAKALRKKLIKEKVIEPNSDDSDYAVSEKSQEESQP